MEHNQDKLAGKSEEDRRTEQRQKQIQYGYNTPGYQNMIKLTQLDPLLMSGNVIPIKPPTVEMKASKRTWDLLIRKWRRALHMFDDVYFGDMKGGERDAEGEEDIKLEDIIERQRRKWISPAYAPTSQHTSDQCSGTPTVSQAPIPGRVSLGTETFMKIRSSTLVPKKLPVEDCMKHVLRSAECYTPLENLLPEVVIGGSARGMQHHSANAAGFKVLVAPSSTTPAAAMGMKKRNGRSPSPDASLHSPTVSNGPSFCTLVTPSTATRSVPLPQSTSPVNMLPLEGSTVPRELSVSPSSTVLSSKKLSVAPTEWRGTALGRRPPTTTDKVCTNPQIIPLSFSEDS